MLSKDIKSGLEDLILDRESFINDENDKDNIFVKDKKVLKSALDYIEQLESKEKRLIEKLEEDNKKAKDGFEATLSSYEHGIMDYSQEILEILKGEKE